MNEMSWVKCAYCSYEFRFVEGRECPGCVLIGLLIAFLEQQMDK